ncbi:MAG: hypothetical protein LLF87_03930, partial [Eubacteriales bacterium]|nr:hypothetical protein [Eubacteriales bacterium]
AQGLGDILVEYGWRFALYGFAALSGVWISALYYRMSKGFKIGVSVGVPALLVYVRAVGGSFSKTFVAAMRAFWATVKYMFGFGGKEPQPAMFCLWGAVLILLSAIIFWACMRRAEVRE